MQMSTAAALCLYSQVTVDISMHNINIIIKTLLLIESFGVLLNKKNKKLQVFTAPDTFNTFPALFHHFHNRNNQHWAEGDEKMPIDSFISEVSFQNSSHS